TDHNALGIRRAALLLTPSQMSRVPSSPNDRIIQSHRSTRSVLGETGAYRQGAHGGTGQRPPRLSSSEDQEDDWRHRGRGGRGAPLTEYESICSARKFRVAAKCVRFSRGIANHDPSSVYAPCSSAVIRSTFWSPGAS